MEKQGGHLPAEPAGDNVSIGVGRPPAATLTMIPMVTLDAAKRTSHAEAMSMARPSA
jgi:hypothetical protein